jgi:hypothetical protein
MGEIRLAAIGDCFRRGGGETKAGTLRSNPYDDGE